MAKGSLNEMGRDGLNKLTKFYIVQVLVCLFIILNSVLLVLALMSGKFMMSLQLIVLILYLIILIFGIILSRKPPSKEDQEKLMENRTYRILYLFNTKVFYVIIAVAVVALVYSMVQGQ